MTTTRFDPPVPAVELLWISHRWPARRQYPPASFRPSRQPSEQRQLRGLECLGYAARGLCLGVRPIAAQDGQLVFDSLHQVEVDSTFGYFVLREAGVKVQVHRTPKLQAESVIPGAGNLRKILADTDSIIPEALAPLLDYHAVAPVGRGVYHLSARGDLLPRHQAG